jgi:DNA/RNA-binding domain of Phe-tRNA-synthetase-like protein
MSEFLPSISPEIASIAPGFRAISIRVAATELAVPEFGAQQLHEACSFVVAGGPTWADAHLQAWADVFRVLVRNHNVHPARPRPCANVY